MTETSRLPTLAMRGMLAAGRLEGRSGRFLQALISGVGLGLLGDAQLRELDELFYATDPTYRTAEWNERGLWDWEEKAIAGAAPQGARVLVIACGGGREVLALLRAGFDATGYESHPELRAYAQRFLAGHGEPDRVGVAERNRFPAAAGRVDAVLVGWGALSLISPRSERVAFLRDAAGAVAPGGTVVCSVFARPGGERWPGLTMAVARPLRAARRAPSRLEQGDTLAPNRVHVFTREQLVGEFGQAGLRVASWQLVGRAAAGIEYACAIGRPA